MSNELKSTKLNNLNEQEKEMVLKILSEMSSNTISKTYTDLLYQDYEEIPVDIDTFLHDPKYLGKGLINEEGKFTVFPYWVKTLKEIFPDPLKPSRYNTVALTGSIGLGKSFEAVLIGLYELYRMLCLKDPYLYYGLQPIDKISFAVMNITLDAARGVAWDKLQQLVQCSEWFMNHGTVTKGQNPQWKPNKKIELICGSQSRHILGRAVYWVFFDEISFIQNQDVNKQKEKAKNLVNTASARMQSRFMKGEINPTVLVVASSKRTENSYMETFIQGKKERESKTTYIVDEPQWVVRTDKDSDRKFKVAVGSKYLASEVLPLDIDENELTNIRNKGYQIIEVPIGYYENFIEDIDIALTDIAGISTSSSNRYISGPRIAEVEDQNCENGFTKEIIEVGNAPDDDSQYYNFFDLSRIPENLKSRPLFIHLDMSLSGDKTGIGGVWVIGKKQPKPNEPVSKEIILQAAFNVSVKAPKGFQVSFEKNRNFIRWLRQQGFNIKGISSDTFQSADLLQVLKAEHFNTEVISVDRVKDNICLPYQYLRNAIYEKRIKFYKSTLLKEELIGLERDNNSGKVDHSTSGINCFTGDTKISLTDGRNLSFIEIVKEFNEGKENYVYSFNHNKQRIEPKLISNAFCSGHVNKLVKVTLDNGEVLKCTPEHKFMLRDGSYIEAQNLSENDSLMPLYTKISQKGLNGYRLYYEPMEDEWHYEHRQFCNQIFDEKYLVHHIDCNKLNNNPNNLIFMSCQSHHNLHSSTSTGPQSIEARQKRIDSLNKRYIEDKKKDDYYCRWYKDMSPEEARKCHEDKVKDEEERRKIREKSHQNNLQKIKAKEQKRQDMCKYFDVKWEDLSDHDKRSLMIKYAHISDPTYQERVSKKISENHKLGKYENAKKALLEYDKRMKGKKRDPAIIEKVMQTKKEHGPYHVSEKNKEILRERTSNLRWYNNGETSIYINKDIIPPEGFVPGRIKTWKNHKVISIEFIEADCDVYDITVNDNHNFALASGIFVHNSKDSADAICGATWNASQHAEELSIDFVEDLENTFTANADAFEQNKQILIDDFEKELSLAFGNTQNINIENTNTSENAKLLDFGFGPSTPVTGTGQFLSEGIMVW